MTVKTHKTLCPKCSKEMKKYGFRNEEKYKCPDRKCKTIVEQLTLF